MELCARLPRLAQGGVCSARVRVRVSGEGLTQSMQRRWTSHCSCQILAGRRSSITSPVRNHWWHGVMAEAAAARTSSSDSWCQPVQATVTAANRCALPC
eukprot:COSAG01_NODE_8019_length_2951_cov_112.303296_2_plen_99_part_00